MTMNVGAGLCVRIDPETVKVEVWCSGRDLNPGRRLSPATRRREAVIHGSFHV